MIPRSQGHCYLQYLHCHHHCPVWPGTGGNPRCCPGPQGLDPHCSRNRRLASQGWHKSRGWRHRCHPPRWARATCGMAAGWPACPLGNPLSISVTRRSRPLEAGGPPCWPGRACGDDLGGSADACVPSWQHTLLGPQHSAPHQVSKRGSESGDRKEKGKLCPLKPKAILGLVSKKSQQSLAVMGPPLWTFVPPSDHVCLCDYQTDGEDAQAASCPPDFRSTLQPSTRY